MTSTNLQAQIRIGNVLFEINCYKTLVRKSITHTNTYIKMKGSKKSSIFLKKINRFKLSEADMVIHDMQIERKDRAIHYTPPIYFAQMSSEKQEEIRKLYDSARDASGHVQRQRS